MNTAVSSATPKSINHDLPTLLRLVAITLIVAAHFGLFEYGGGGAALLMVIVGYNIATFKLPKVLKTGSVLPIIMMIIKVMIPTIAYILLIQLYYDSFRLIDVLLVSNFFNEHHPMGFSYWFIEVYIQVQIILLILLALKPIRNMLIKNEKLTAYGFVLISTLLYLITDSIWDFSSLYRRLPWLMLWLVAFGFASRCADSLPEKAILSLCFIIVSTIYYDSVHWFLVTCVVLLIINPPFKLPTFLKKPIGYIAAGSLFIYLTHFQVKAVIEKIIQDSPLIYTISALIIGATLFHLYNRYINKEIPTILKKITNKH